MFICAAGTAHRWRPGCEALIFRIRQQVRTQKLRPGDRLFAPPSVDVRVMATEQNIWHAVSAKLKRPGELWIFEQSVAKRFVGRRCVFDYAGDQPCNRIDHNHCRELTAGEDVITNRELISVQDCRHTSVHTFVPTANQCNPAGGRELAGHRLSEPATTCREEHDHRLFAITDKHILNGLDDWRRFEHHAGAAAIRRIVGRTMAVVGPFSNVVDSDVDDSLILGSTKNALSQRAPEHAREQCEDVEPKRRLHSMGRVLVERF